MHITGLEASGLKGLSFQHQLQRCVLITGKNWSGKSARLEAIRLALLGFVPALGKQNQSTWGLSGGGTVTVDVSFDNGGGIGRTFQRDGESIKSIARPKLGADPATMFDGIGDKMPMLDPAEYFALTDSERVQYVFGMMKMPDTFTRDGIFADIRNLPLDEHTEQTEKAKREIVDLVNRSFSPGQPLTTALIDAIADLKQEFTVWNRRAKDTQGTLRVLSELKTRSGECSADTIQRVAGELTRVSNALEVANRESGDMSRRQMEANRVGLRRQQIEKELEAKSTVDQGAIDRSVKAVADCDKKLKKKPEISADMVEMMRAAYTDSKNGADNLLNVRAALENELAGADKAIEEIARLTQCPYCKSKGKGWRDNLRNDLVEQRGRVTDRLATLDGQIGDVNKMLEKAKGIYDKAQNAQDARQALLNLRAGYQSTLDSLNARTAGVAARRQALQEELTSLKDVSAPTEAELLDAATRTVNLKTEHARLSQQHTNLVQLQQDLIRAGEAAEEHRIAAAKVTVIKAVGALLKDRQASMIDVLFRDLMKVANYFTGGIMEHPLVFQDGRIGYVKQGRFVSHKTFSGTERALTYIAITAALMKDAPLRIVLLDEFDIDADVFPKVLDRLNGAVSEGHIDQVIVAHTELPSAAVSFRAAQWQHIPL